MTKFGCNYTSSTTNRGVEAKEVEIANTRLDRNATESSSSFPADSSAPSAPSVLPAGGLDADVSGSYVQVVVQKHRRARAAAAAQTSPRLPAASSPIRQACETTGAGDGKMLLLPASVLLACPSQQHEVPQYKIIRERVSRGADAATSPRADRADRADGGDERRDALQPAHAGPEKILKNSAWKILSSDSADGLDSSDNSPERVEVYYFERSSGAFLATGGARRARRVEGARRRVRRAAGAAAAEALAAAQLLLALPAALLVGLERCVLTVARDALTGGVQTAADYALKPALALAFNALLQPPLVFCANVARALREVVRPLSLMAGDALEPLCRALGALRLVHVHVDSRPSPAACRCGGDLV